MLDKYGIEISGGVGPLAGEIWRIGLMGENAREESVAALLTWSPSADRSSTTRTFLHASPMAGPSTTI